MTNEVLQKTTSDEQNVSSFNDLKPSIRFPEFNENYKTINLSEYLFENKDRNKSEIYTKQEVLSVSGEFGIVNQIKLQGRSFAGESVKEYHIVETNDIVYTKSPLKANPYGIIKVNKGIPGIVSTLYAVYHVKNTAFPEYIDYYFSNDLRLNKYLKPLVNIGAKHDMKVNNETVLIGYVTFPKVEEQQKVSNFLSLIDRRIEKQQQLVESLKKYKRGLFLKLYNDFDKSIISFKNIYEMASEGGTPSTSDSENYENGKIPFIKIDDLNQHYLNFAKYFITEKGLKKSSAWIVPENSIIYSNGATIGACSINKIPVTTKQGILGIVPKSNFSVEFLYFFFTSSIFKQKIRAITTKGTMDCAYLKDINGIKISIPDFIAQQKIAKIMVDFENLIERTELSFIYLQNIKKALLHQMFI